MNMGLVKVRWFFEVADCPRCHRVHENLRLNRFEERMLGRFAFWTTCPRTGAPIVVEGAEEDTKKTPLQWERSDPEFSVASTTIDFIPDGPK